MIGSLHQIGVITRLTFHEARRRRLLWIGLGLGGAFVALFALGFYFVLSETNYESIGVRGDLIRQQEASVMLTAGLYVVNFLIVMITALTSVGAISGEIASGTIHAIASKPIRRWEIVAGKWLGYASMITIYTLLMVGALMLVAYAISGFVPPNAVPALLVLILEGLTVLSITLLGSALVSTLANGVLVFMLYGVAFIGGWVEQIGVIVNSQAARELGILSSLLMPGEALWRYAAALMQPPGLMGSITPFSVASQPTPAFVVYSVIYVVALLGGAMWAFGRRDF